jgi:hypothetical protein
MKNICLSSVKSTLVLPLMIFSTLAFAGSKVTIEAEVNEYKHGGDTWDTRYLPGDPAPDVMGNMKLIGGETCEIPLNKDTHIIKHTCSFTNQFQKGDAVSIQLWDKDVGRPDDLIYSGSVVVNENPTILENPPNSFLKSLKISY